MTLNGRLGPNEQLVDHLPKPIVWQVYVKKNRKGYSDVAGNEGRVSIVWGILLYGKVRERKWVSWKIWILLWGESTNAYVAAGILFHRISFNLRNNTQIFLYLCDFITMNFDVPNQLTAHLDPRSHLRSYHI